MRIDQNRWQLAVCFFAVLIPSACLAENWPQFRGAEANGVASSRCPVSWSATGDSTKNVRWKVPIAGEGWSAPVVWGKQVFLTAAVPVASANGDAARTPRNDGRRRDDPTQTVYRYQVRCLDANTGETLWTQTARQGRPPIPRHSQNSYATETPITDGERLYAYFGMNGVYCYDLQGELQWKKDLGAFKMRAGWGTSSSPVLFDGKLIVQADNEQQSFLVALDVKSGDEVWRVQRDEASQYSTPLIWKNRLRSELIIGGMTYRSYDPDTGELLWQLDMGKGRSSATPLAVGDRLFVGTELRNRGGADDGGGFVFAVTPGGSGEITPIGDATASEFVAWKIDRSGIQMASPTICQGNLYFLERRTGSLHCVDAESGRSLYRKRLPGARAFWASPWTSGGRVYCLDTSGTTYVLSGGPEYELLSQNEIEEQAWSTPAIAGGVLYLRTVNHLYCIAE